MAAITFNTAHPKGQVREQLDVVLAAFRRMLDSFVSYQMRQAAAEAQHACPRQTPVSPTKNEVNAMQLTSTDFSSRQPTERSTPAVLQDGERSGILPPDRPATVAAQFRPLDPGVVSETIPAFFIGRNKQGFWVARDVNGRIGGIFLLENSAVSFARSNSGAAGCASIYLSERFELDLENRGNPFVVQLGSCTRMATHLQRRMAAMTGKVTEAVNRRLKDFRGL